jgi:hypothetical protein
MGLFLFLFLIVFVFVLLVVFLLVLCCVVLCSVVFFSSAFPVVVVIVRERPHFLVYQSMDKVCPEDGTIWELCGDALSTIFYGGVEDG